MERKAGNKLYLGLENSLPSNEAISAISDDFKENDEYCENAICIKQNGCWVLRVYTKKALGEYKVDLEVCNHLKNNKYSNFKFFNIKTPNQNLLSKFGSFGSCSGFLMYAISGESKEEILNILKKD